jgi:hypothetical protein
MNKFPSYADAIRRERAAFPERFCTKCLFRIRPAANGDPIPCPRHGGVAVEPLKPFVRSRTPMISETCPTGLTDAEVFRVIGAHLNRHLIYMEFALNAHHRLIPTATNEWTGRVVNSTDAVICEDDIVFNFGSLAQLDFTAVYNMACRVVLTVNREVLKLATGER